MKECRRLKSAALNSKQKLFCDKNKKSLLTERLSVNECGEKTADELKMEEKIRSLLKNVPFLTPEDSSLKPSTSGYTPISKMGYLSHDYWPSLLCISDNQDYVRFFNLTNTRNQGSFRYYRCSKCSSLKTSVPTNFFNFEFDNEAILPSPDELLTQFCVPKIQISGKAIVTDLSKLRHHPDCKAISIPTMIADQLDRRARRQVSLGLLEPRDAWNQAYLEAVRISSEVMRLHPGFESVANIFPSYKVARVQYNRHFYKNSRCLSQTIEDNVFTSKQRKNSSKLRQPINTNKQVSKVAIKNKNNWTCSHFAFNKSDLMRKSAKLKNIEAHQQTDKINQNQIDSRSIKQHYKYSKDYFSEQFKSNFKMSNFYSPDRGVKIGSSRDNIVEPTFDSIDLNLPSKSNDYVIVDGYYDCSTKMCLLDSRYKENSEICLKLYDTQVENCFLSNQEIKNDSFLALQNNYETDEEVLILQGNEDLMKESVMSVYECDNSSFLLTRSLTPDTSSSLVSPFDEISEIDNFLYH